MKLIQLEHRTYIIHQFIHTHQLMFWSYYLPLWAVEYVEQNNVRRIKLVKELITCLMDIINKSI